MGLARRSNEHPIFTAEGCREILTLLHAEFRKYHPEIYENEKTGWFIAQQQADRLVENPDIFGSTSAFGCLIAMTNNLQLCGCDPVSHALVVANYLSGLPVIDNFIWRNGFKDAVEAALMMTWPDVVHVVNRDPETRIVTVDCHHYGNLKGMIKKAIYGYPSPADVLSCLNRFFGDPDFVRFDSVIVNSQVRLFIFHNITEKSVIGASIDTDSRGDFRRDIINMAWRASGNV